MERKGHIAGVTLNRPSRLNAFNRFVLEALGRVTAELKKRLPRVIIITGAGDKTFSAGFDVNPDNPLFLIWSYKLTIYHIRRHYDIRRHIAGEKRPYCSGHAQPAVTAERL